MTSSINLTGTVSSIDLCIICQKKSTMTPNFTENGRKRIIEAAKIRGDAVQNRIIMLGSDFIYHMNNECYKTHRGHLNRLANEHTLSVPETLTPVQDPNKKITRSKSGSTKQNEVCTICGYIKHNNVSIKYRICERDRAHSFLLAARYFQDDVYLRTCDLVDVEDVFAADIRCHETCIRNYIRDYNKSVTEVSNLSTESNQSLKHKNISQCVEKILPQLKAGIGFTLTYISGQLKNIRNRDVKQVLDEMFGNTISYVVPKEANRPTMFFLSTVSIEDVVNTLRAKDDYVDCARKLRETFLKVDFELDGEFSDEQNIKMAWNNMQIPPNVLLFFSELFCFDINTFYVPRIDDDLDTFDKTKSKFLKVVSVYQMLIYIIRNGRKKTPLHLMNGLAVHDHCRGKGIINSLNHIGVSISYDEVLRNRNDLAQYVVEVSGGDVPLPTRFRKDMFTVGAFDNFDHNENSLSGMNSTHDTVAVLFHDKFNAVEPKKPKIKNTNVSHRERAFKNTLNCQTISDFYEPSKSITLPENFSVSRASFLLDSQSYEAVKRKDLIWEICRMAESRPASETEQQKVPSWSAFNSLCSEEKASEQIVGFLPKIPSPVTKYSTVYTALLNLKNVLKQLQQEKLAVACDEEVYRLARHITLLRPTEFENIVLLLGNFHLTKIALACAGKYIKGGGGDTIFIETSVFGISTTENVLTGSNYYRSFKGMVLLSETLRRLQFKEFFKRKTVEKFQGDLERINKFKSRILNGTNEEARKAISEYLEKPPGKLETSFAKFIKNRRIESDLFAYWDNVIHLISLVKDLVRADRERNWLLHVSTVQKLLPIFYIFDHTNYVRWCSIYLEDMKALPITAPDLYTQFMDGKFTVRRSSKYFSAVGIDMCLEQTINRSKKSSSGVIGETRKKSFVTEWEMIYHEILAISTMYRKITGVLNDNYELQLHHEMSPNTTDEFETQVKNMMDFIEDKENPFGAGANTLRNIVTQVQVDKETKEAVLNVFGDADDLFEVFWRERFVEKSKPISAVIHRNNLPSFDFCCQVNLLQPEISNTKKNTSGHKILALSKERGYPMEKLMSFELVDNNFLFDKQGFPTKATKHSMVLELETWKMMKNSSVTEYNPTDSNSSCVVDSMAYIRKLSIPTIKEKTFKGFSKNFFKMINGIVPKATSRVDFIFDSYVVGSSKAYERLRRSVKGAIELNRIEDDVPLPKQLDKFWSSSENKVKLQSYIKASVLGNKSIFREEIDVFCSATIGDSRSPCISSNLHGVMTEHPELSFDSLEEADVRIMPHIIHAAKSGITEVLVLSPDTDVVILLLYHWTTFNKNGVKKLWIRVGTGKTKRFIPIHMLAEAIGPEVCSVLVAAHIITESDYTSKFGTKLSALICKPEKYLSGFAKLIDRDSVEETIVSAEKYLVQVLKHDSHCQSMDQLRLWMLNWGNQEKGIENLPPTSRSVRQHILRSLYCTYNQITCLEPQPLLDPTLFGYIHSGDWLLPNTAIILFPDEDDLVPNCNCIKCARKSCCCFGNNLPCCVYCKCQSMEKVECKNPFSTLDNVKDGGTI